MSTVLYFDGLKGMRYGWAKTAALAKLACCKNTRLFIRVRGF
jgi:hypothetical protein